MHVGFTGTRHGATPSQSHGVETALRVLHLPPESWLHHGDCVGADDEAHRVARLLGYRTWLHPAEDPAWRNWSEGADREDAPLPPLLRNQVIVNRTSALVACPRGPEEQRSGTWSTVRAARRLGRDVWVIWPDGRIQRERGTPRGQETGQLDLFA